jgi:hypothetical protein
MTEVRSDEQLEDKSVGELVKVATENVSQLIKSEIALARLELMNDAKRVGIGGAMFVVAAFAFGATFLMLSFAAAYGLRYLLHWLWLDFLIVGVVYAVLGVLLLLIGKGLMKKMTGVSRTRRTVKDDISALRRGGDGQQPAITD